MTPDELYAHGYSLEYAMWGVSVYRTVDGSHGASDAAVQGVKTIQFGEPMLAEKAQQLGWEAAQVDLVKRRLS